MQEEEQMIIYLGFLLTKKTCPSLGFFPVGIVKLGCKNSLNLHSTQPNPEQTLYAIQIFAPCGIRTCYVSSQSSHCFFFDAETNIDQNKIILLLTISTT